MCRVKAWYRGVICTPIPSTVSWNITTYRFGYRDTVRSAPEKQGIDINSLDITNVQRERVYIKPLEGTSFVEYKHQVILTLSPPRCT